MLTSTYRSSKTTKKAVSAAETAFLHIIKRKLGSELFHGRGLRADDGIALLFVALNHDVDVAGE